MIQSQIESNLLPKLNETKTFQHNNVGYKINFFVLVNAKGLLLGYNPEKQSYRCLYKRYDMLNIWDFCPVDMKELWFKSQPEPKEPWTFKLINPLRLRRHNRLNF